MRYRSALLLMVFAGLPFAHAETELAVALDTGGPVTPGVLKAMEQEAGSLIAKSGVRLIWTTKTDTRAYESVAVITLHGSCGTALPQPTLGSEILGLTHVADGEVLPFADIRCDSVRRAIGREMRAATPQDREELVGRALGRVVAHELYHVVFRTCRHSRKGFGSARQSSVDLLGEAGRR